jgi:hypothetical protein
MNNLGTESRLAYGVSMKKLVCALMLLLSATAVCQRSKADTAQPTRFFKAECGTAAQYLELRRDGVYRVVAREHAGPMQTERGRWRQEGSVIAFTPSSQLGRGKTVNFRQESYDGTEEHYKGKTFLTFTSENSAGIVIPSEDTKRQLDGDMSALPLYVFFKTTRSVFAGETKQPYPFRYLKPNR